MHRLVIFILTDATANDDRQYVVPFSDILPGTVRMDPDHKTVITFFTKKSKRAEFKIKFNNETEAEAYVEGKVTRYSDLETLVRQYNSCYPLSSTAS